MLVQEKLQIKIKIKDNLKKFGALILKVAPMKNSFNGEILGRQLVDWVAFACEDMPIKVVDYDGKENVLSFSKDILNEDCDYTIILLSTTPLIEKGVIKDIMEYCTYKDIKICKLPVGYVVNNKYLKSNENINIDSLYSQNLEDFYVVENKKQYNYALGVLQDRINTFHINNGVDIKDPKSVYIEPEVDIASGAIIYAGNSLKGRTIIENDVILKENNVIENSKIGKNSCISGSVISGTVILGNVYISAFCEIQNCLVGSYCTISSGCKINNYKLEDNLKIKANTVLGEEDDSDSRTGQSR